MPTVALLSSKIPGLVDFGTRLGPILRAASVEFIHLATSRYDLFSEAVPVEAVEYLADRLASDAPTALTASERDYFERNVSSSVFWPDIDRYMALDLPVPTTFARADLAELLFAFFVQAIKHHDIAMLLYELPSNCFALSALHAARHLGVPLVALNPGRMPGRFEFLLDPMTPETKLREIFETAIFDASELQAATAYIENIDRTLLEYMASTGYNPQSLIAKYSNGTRLRRFRTEWEASRALGVEGVPNLFFERPLLYRWRFAMRTLRRQGRLRRLAGYFVPAVPAGPFVLYPVHFHPEASTSVFGHLYQDELHTITLIASNLPIGMKLVVKDHIHAVGHEDLEFYRKLDKLPNVVVLDPVSNIKAAIRAACAVVTNTSTAGFEALALGIPVFLLGGAIYDYVPWCRKLGHPEQLFTNLAELPPAPSIEERRRFVATYLRGTLAGAFNFDVRHASPGIVEVIGARVVSVLGSGDTDQRRVQAAA